jgi:hypothetical protein
VYINNYLTKINLTTSSFFSMQKTAKIILFKKIPSKIININIHFLPKHYSSKMEQIKPESTKKGTEESKEGNSKFG